MQVSLAEILWALAENRIDHKAAGLMLYTLQQASTNLNQTHRWKGQRDAVEYQRPLRAINLPDFEKRFDLPDNVDLDTDPDVAPPENIYLSSVQAQLERGSSPSSPHMASSDNLPPAPDNSTVGAPPLSPGFGDRVGSEAPISDPDRVPLPENVLEDLQMTQAEKLMFFNYCMEFDAFENEDRLKVTWLRQRRLDEQQDNELGAELRAERAAWEASLARTRPQDTTEAA